MFKKFAKKYTPKAVKSPIQNYMQLISPMQLGIAYYNCRAFLHQLNTHGGLSSMMSLPLQNGACDNLQYALNVVHRAFTSREVRENDRSVPFTVKITEYEFLGDLYLLSYVIELYYYLKPFLWDKGNIFISTYTKNMILKKARVYGFNNEFDKVTVESANKLHNLLKLATNSKLNKFTDVRKTLCNMGSKIFAECKYKIKPEFAKQFIKMRENNPENAKVYAYENNWVELELPDFVKFSDKQIEVINNFINNEIYKTFAKSKIMEDEYLELFRYARVWMRINFQKYVEDKDIRQFIYAGYHYDGSSVTTYSSTTYYNQLKERLKNGS